MQSRIKHLLKHFALVLKTKLNQLKPFVRFVLSFSLLLHTSIYRNIKGLHVQIHFKQLYVSFSCPYIHSYIISADGFYIIVDQSFHIVKLHSQTVLLPYDNFSSQFSLQPCLRGHSC